MNLPNISAAAALLAFVASALFAATRAGSEPEEEEKPPAGRLKAAAGLAAPLVAIILAALAGFPHAANRFVENRGEWMNAGPNVLMIGIDTLRADHLSCHGYERDTAPTLGWLASKGYLFERNYSQSHWTLPSFMSVFTSAYPSVNGLTNRGERVSDQATLLAEVLKKNEYYTAGIASSPWLSARYGYGRGFDYYNDYFHLRTRGGAKFKTIQEMIHFLRSREKFFLFVHLYDPHRSYRAPGKFGDMFVERSGKKKLHDIPHAYFMPSTPADPEDIAELVARYDGEIRYTDTVVNDLIKLLRDHRLWNKTLVVVFSDHGEEFREHGSMDHGPALYEELVHTPLIIRDPRKRPPSGGVRIASLTMNLDIAPTILDLLELPAPETFQGVSLLPVMEGDTSRVNTHVFAETSRIRHEIRMASDGRFKVITHLPAPVWKTEERDAPHPIVARPFRGSEAYDLLADPGEQEDLMSGDTLSEGGVAVREALEWWIESLEPMEEKEDTKSAAKMSPAERERLRALGYVK